MGWNYRGNKLQMDIRKHILLLTAIQQWNQNVLRSRGVHCWVCLKRGWMTICQRYYNGGFCSGQGIGFQGLFKAFHDFMKIDHLGMRSPSEYRTLVFGWENWKWEKKKSKMVLWKVPCLNMAVKINVLLFIAHGNALLMLPMNLSSFTIQIRMNFWILLN